MNNLHDKFVKEFLLKKQNAIDFLKVALPDDVLRVLDLEQLKPTQNSFITKDIKELFSDVVYKCKLTTGADSYCSILIEHKSYKDPLVGFQVGHYIFNGYLQQIKNKEPFHVIIPLIFYHHEDKWIFKSVESYFNNISEELSRFIPRFDTVFFDVKLLSDETIFEIRNTALTTMLITQKHRIRPEELLDRMEKIFESLQTQEERNSFERNFVYILYIFKKEDYIIDLIRKNKDKPINHLFMTLYESITKKSKLEGKLEGEQIGIQKGKFEVVINGYNNGLSIPILTNITGFSEDEILRILEEHKKS